MLYGPRTLPVVSSTRYIDPTASVISDEGSALVAGKAGTVKDSTGTSGEFFVGFSSSQRSTLNTFPAVGHGTVPATGPYEVVLPNAPLNGTLRLVNANTGAVLVAGASDDYTVTNKTATFDAALAGLAVAWVFEYAPTLMQARQIQGDVQPGGTVPQNYGVVGVIGRGDVYTTRFDTNADWTSASPDIRAGANGKLTIGGNGAKVNGYIINVPSQEYPFLGICLI